MGYLLVKPEVLKAKGIENYETIPDGRAVVDFSMLRVLGSIPDVEIVSTASEVLAKIEEQKKSGLYDKPQIDAESPLPDGSVDVPADTTDTNFSEAEQSEDPQLDNKTKKGETK